MAHHGFKKSENSVKVNALLGLLFAFGYGTGLAGCGRTKGTKPVSHRIGVFASSFSRRMALDRHSPPLKSFVWPARTAEQVRVLDLHTAVHHRIEPGLARQPIGIKVHDAQLLP